MLTTLLFIAGCLVSQIGGDGSPKADPFALSISEFTVGLLKSIPKSSGENILFSPSSINMLLSQLQQGSSGKTEEQFSSVLYRDLATSRTGYLELLKSAAKDNKGVTLKLASKTFLKPDFPISAEFKKTLVEDFGADVENLDVTAPDAVSAINKWVETATEGHIKDLVSEGSLTSDSVMVLLSAVYFKGKWKVQFRKGRSTSARFFVAPNSTVMVPYMLQNRHMIAGVSPELQLKWIQLPYEGDDFVMLVMLPTIDHNLDGAIQKLTGSELSKIISAKATKLVRLRMPRFTMKMKTKLQEPLTAMGLGAMFSDAAEFPKISPQHGVKVSEALHEALLEVNEDGSEASAATGLVVNTLSLSSYQDEMQFTVNQPFLVVICDKARNIPHFVAKVVNPS